MNSALPKDCNCTETSTNQGEVCGNATHTTDEFFYNGPNSSCTELQNHDDITITIQKLENFLCSVEVTQQVLTYIENNIEDFSDFITLVNDALTCETISNCFTPMSICFTVSTECETGNCSETFYVNPSVNINDRPSYSVDGIFEVFYNPALNRWESWEGMAISSYLESNLFYPAGIWLPVVPGAYISFSNNDVCPTTTTTTTLALCQEYLWESFGVNSSNLEYKDCDGVSIVINSVDITNNSGTICVYPNTVPVWNPTPSTGYHQISTVGNPCVNPTTTTTSSTSTSTSTSTTTSTSSSTTTTTTTAVPLCKSYTLEADITNASWFGTYCENSEETGGVVVPIGGLTDTGCIFDNSLVLNGMSIKFESECTTTTTSTSTSTTTSSTTSTTTTLYPCVTKQFLVINNTASTVNNIDSLGWLYTGFTPVYPYTSLSGIQNGTNNAISVDMDPVVESGCISLYVNTVLIQTIPFYYNDIFTFDPYVISKDDCVWIVINSEGC